MTAQLPSRERLEKISNFHSSMALPPSHDEIEVMARFILAAYEQEPVAMRWRWKGDGWNGPGEWIYHDHRYFDKLSACPTRECELVYTNPAPVPCRAALQSGNSAQPEPVNKTYKLLPNSFSDDELMGMAHGDNPAANAYRELLEFRRNAANGNPWQPVTVPDGYALVPVEPTQEMVWAAKNVLKHTVGWDSFVELYKAMLAAAPTAPDGWIPVSERMPDFFYSVLVADEYEDMTIATPVDLSTGDRCAFRMSNGDVFLATHWQPLPDAPKGV